MEHELLMAETWCNEVNILKINFNLFLFLINIILLQATNRVNNNLKFDKKLNIFNNLSKISKNMCDVGGCVQLNPLGF